MSTSTSAPVLVFNATGMIGTALVQQLHDSGVPVVAAVRDTSKTTPKLPSAVQRVQVEDYNDAEAIQQAVASTGAKRAFGLNFVATPNALAAMKAGGLTHLVFVSTSFVGLPTEPIALQQWMGGAEGAIKASGLTYTFLRPEVFMSNAFRWQPQIAATGRVISAHPDVAERIVAFDDIAAVAATALTTQQYDNQVVTIQGPAGITERQQLQHISQLKGKPIEVVQVSEADFKAKAASPQFPPPVIDSVNAVKRFRQERGGDFQAQTDALVTGKVTFEQFIAQNKHEFTGSA